MTTFQFIRKKWVECHLKIDKAMQRNASKKEIEALVNEADHYGLVCELLRKGGDIMENEIKEIADHYGYEAQSNQLVEECAELIQAVSKYRRATTGAGQPLADYKKTVALENLIEEIADVEVMLEQIKYLLQISAVVIEAVKRYKITRTNNRIKNRGNFILLYFF